MLKGIDGIFGRFEVSAAKKTFESTAQAIPVTRGGTSRGGFANVVLFGAVGDGQSDSTEAFNKAIASLATSAGGVLVVPKETCEYQNAFPQTVLALWGCSVFKSW